MTMLLKDKWHKLGADKKTQLKLTPFVYMAPMTSQHATKNHSSQVSVLAMNKAVICKYHCNAIHTVLRTEPMLRFNWL